MPQLNIATASDASGRGAKIIDSDGMELFEQPVIDIDLGEHL
jgi:hypothetical protein